MDEFPQNLWAPWRMEYIRSLSEESKQGSGCFLCDYRDARDRDASHHVVWRTRHAMVVMNRFPYTNGHLLVAPLSHAAEFEALTSEEFAALWWTTRDAKDLLTHAVAPHGFNVGLNFGLCAGAGLPGHLHVHIVPRWNGDTNFMAVLGDVRVVPQSLDALYDLLLETSSRCGLPSADPADGENP